MGQKANIMTFEQTAVYGSVYYNSTPTPLVERSLLPGHFKQSCCQRVTADVRLHPLSLGFVGRLKFPCAGFTYRFPFLCLPTPLPLQKNSKEFPKHAVEFSQPSRAIITSGLDCGTRERAEAWWLTWALSFASLRDLKHQWNTLQITVSTRNPLLISQRHNCSYKGTVWIKWLFQPIWFLLLFFYDERFQRFHKWPSLFCLKEILIYMIQKYMHTYRPYVKHLCIYIHSPLFYLNSVQRLFPSR